MEIKDRILDYLKEKKEKAQRENQEKISQGLPPGEDNPITIKEIIEALHSSYPTISKWLLMLEAEKKVRVSDFGNIKFYYLI